MRFIKRLPLMFFFVFIANGQMKLPLIFDHSLALKSGKVLPEIISNVALPESSIRILAVMVSFQEDNDDRTTGNGNFDLTTPTKRFLDAPPHNHSYFQNHLTFLNNYFRKVSDGKLNVTGRVLDSIYRLPHQMRYYSPLKSSTTNLELGYLMRDTWHLVDSLAKIWNIDIPFEQYNAFVIFHAGAGRDIDLVSNYGYDPTPYDIPSIYLNNSSLQKMDSSWSAGFPVKNASFFITNSIIIPETETRDQVPFPLGLNGLLAASVGSRLGLPDLFNTKNGRSGIGRFGLMDGQSIFSWNGAFPPEPSAWEKKFLGWVNPISIASGDSIYYFSAVSLSNSADTIYQVLISGKEYFLVENRNRDANRDGATVTMIINGETVVRSWSKDTTHFNAYLPDSLYGVITDVDEYDWSLPGGYDKDAKIFYDGGLLIWHIDETVINANFATNSINANPSRRGVNLMEADGSQDIGQSYGFLDPGSGSENGTALDFWYKGNIAPLRKDLNALTPTSHPSSRSNDGANSHIYIGNSTRTDTTGLSDRGRRMFARIRIGDELITPLPGFPKNLQRTFGENSIAVEDLNGDGQKDILVATRIMSVTMRNAEGQFELLPSNGILSGWQTNGTALTPYLKTSGILFSETLPDRLDFFGKPAISDIDGDNIQDFGVLNQRDNAILSLPPQNKYDFYTIKDQNHDSLADHIVGNDVWIGGFLTLPSIVISDSFYVVPENKSVRIVERSGNLITSSSVSFPDSSYISGISVWHQPDEFILTSRTGEVGIITPSGVLRFRNLAASLQRGAIAGVISPTIGKMIVLTSKNGLIYLLDENLNIMPGFPLATGGEIFNLPALADIDGDGQKDIVVFSGNEIYAINANGVLLDNFPIKVQTDKTILTSPIVADVDGNGTVDIVAVTQEGLIVAYDKNRKMAEGFPILCGPNNGSTPAAFYVPSDCLSCIDIGLAVASDDGYVYAWKTGQLRTGLASPPVMPWPQYMHDAQNTSLDETILQVKLKSTEFLPTSLAYNWPNPVTASDGFKTHIRYFISEDAKVHIKIIDPAGDLVAEFDGPGIGGLDNEVEWDVSKLQSGVYFARVEATSSGKNGHAFIKIAVVR